jgi:DNA-binding NarL/FixJ family response regulator
MPRAISAVIVAAGPFRRALKSHLRPPSFSIVASKASLSDIGSGELPQFESCLFVIECDESPAPLISQIARLKRQNPLARFILVGQRFIPADIATAFEAGANAYFADAAVSSEFLQAITLLVR